MRYQPSSKTCRSGFVSRLLGQHITPSTDKFVVCCCAVPLLLQGNQAACLQLLTRGSQLNKADPALYQARGVVEKELGRFDAARALFKQGLAVDSQHMHLWQVSNRV